MKRAVAFLVCLTVLMACFSCAPTYETKGDAAYKAAQKSSGDIQRRHQKEAYMFYHRAVKAHPAKVNNRLRNRFIEMSLVRATMVLSEGSMEMDALPLFMQEIDSTLTGDVDPAIRQKYVDFLLQMADSSIMNEKIYKGMDFIDKALNISLDKSAVQKKKDDLVGGLAKQNFDIAESEYSAGVEDKNTEALLRAEYRVRLALYYDSRLPGAADLLSKIRKLNVTTYSAYKAVITDRPDTTIFRKIDEFDIFLAVPTTKGGTYQVSMYNNSWNPLRLKPEQFMLVSEDGKRYPALNSSKIDKEILEQEHEIKMNLRFPAVKGKVRKIIFESQNKEHYSEKYFF